MSQRSLRGTTAVVGVGETAYYRHGQAPEPEFVLCLKAILAACADAGDLALTVPYGQMSPAQWYAPLVTRFMHDHAVGQEALRAIALASYHHAQSNPRAVMYGRPLSEAQYDASRWITEPFHLYDC